MAPRYLEGDHRHLVWPPRRPQGFLYAADLEHEHRVGPGIDGTPDGYRVDDSAIEVVRPVALHRGKQAGDRTGSQHRGDEVPLVEPGLVRGLDTRCHTFETDPEFLEGRR